jgi:hypothetical protein
MTLSIPFRVLELAAASRAGLFSSAQTFTQADLFGQVPLAVGGELSDRCRDMAFIQTARLPWRRRGLHLYRLACLRVAKHAQLRLAKIAISPIINLGIISHSLNAAPCKGMRPWGAGSPGEKCSYD